MTTGMRELRSVISSTRAARLPTSVSRPTSPSPVIAAWPRASALLRCRHRSSRCAHSAPPELAMTRAVTYETPFSGTTFRRPRSWLVVGGELQRHLLPLQQPLVLLARAGDSPVECRPSRAPGRPTSPTAASGRDTASSAGAAVVGHRCAANRTSVRSALPSDDDRRRQQDQHRQRRALDRRRAAAATTGSPAPARSSCR